MIPGAHFDGQEYAWHEHGADVPLWFVIGWGIVMLAVLGLVGWLLL